MAKEFRNHAFWRGVMAELIGMTLFVFISITAALGSESNGADQEVKVSLAFGLAIATLAQSLGHISGAHLNPAVTLGLLTSCQISVLRAVVYIIVQVLGATMASGIVYGLQPKNNTGSLGLNKLTNISPGQAVFIELLVTFQLVLCVIATTDKKRSDVTGSAPLAIGLSVALGHLGAISYTGCGMNPARSFGPSAVMWEFEDHWVFWVGPMVGGVAAALVYDFILYPKPDHLPDRLKVLVNGQTGEYDVSSPADNRVEMTSK
ncbi:aquaporin FA-CHIP-like [Acipenser oxyrinchus oxyrinchus]|uniref:Aquaporin FA-CHIP-like n=1 Tax=Acipenser oxyrinchus oxyrinchus TaxID=40147 RepID=A0AAD8LRD4_ACIOX|nr:aquaporin FA-CHIP-like [Acipenser oxyrinchus oxyrinchus]